MPMKWDNIINSYQEIFVQPFKNIIKGKESMTLLSLNQKISKLLAFLESEYTPINS
jgi:hypothetical protein